MTESEIDSDLKKAFDLRTTDLQGSVSQTLHLLEKSKELGYADLSARAMNNLGLFYVVRGEFDIAREYSHEALRHFEKKHDLRGIADAKYNLGSIGYRTNEHPEALVLLRDCLQIYRRLDDHYNQARTLKSLGTVYELFGDFNKAMESYQASLRCAKIIGNEALESNVLNPLSTIYYKLGDKRLALETIERSILLKKKTNDIRGLAFALYGKGKIMLRERQFDKALENLTETVQIQQQVGDNLGFAMALNKLGEAYMEKGDTKAAEDILNKAYQHADQYSLEIIRFRVYLNTYKLMKKLGNATAALDYLERYFNCKEAYFNKENYTLIQSYDAVSRIEKLEMEAASQRERNEIIERKNAELDSFFYRVSHDLKGPISSMLGLHALAKLEVKDPEAQRMFDMCHSQVRRVNDIVMGLINLTRISNAEEAKVPISFERLVEECIESCRYLPFFSSVAFRKKISSISLHSEWAIINTILQNLIENAVKYCRPDDNPYVEIRISQDDHSVLIEVEDNGQGISEQHQKHVFDMFFRSSERMQGSGLGLYILKRAVERLKGTITLRSFPGKGSLFQVQLPRSEEASQQTLLVRTEAASANS